MTHPTIFALLPVKITHVRGDFSTPARRLTMISTQRRKDAKGKDSAPKLEMRTGSPCVFASLRLCVEFFWFRLAALCSLAFLPAIALPSAASR